MVPSSDLLTLIQARHPTAIQAADEPNDTARSWKIPGYKGSFGFISSMSDHFCATCNRLRLTADGQIKVSIFLSFRKLSFLSSYLQGVSIRR
jgi:cyclic pyranopterin phosphate synthase